MVMFTAVQTGDNEVTAVVVQETFNLIRKVFRVRAAGDLREVCMAGDDYRQVPLLIGCWT